MSAEFLARFRRAVKHIQAGQVHGRELDEAFENWDGDAMVAALMKHADDSPTFAQDMRRYMFRNQDAPEGWRKIHAEHARDSWADLCAWSSRLKANHGRPDTHQQAELFALA